MELKKNLNINRKINYVPKDTYYSVGITLNHFKELLWLMHSGTFFKENITLYH